MINCKNVDEEPLSFGYDKPCSLCNNMRNDGCDCSYTMYETEDCEICNEWFLWKMLVDIHVTGSADGINMIKVCLNCKAIGEENARMDAQND